MTLSHVWPLVLLLAIAFVWRVQKTTSLQREGSRLERATVLRSALLALVALALTNPQWEGSTGELSVVFVLDVSRSVDPAFVNSALAWIEKTAEEGPAEQTHFVAFAATPRLVDGPAGLRVVPVSQRGALEGVRVPKTTVDQSRTNLERALRSALRCSSSSRVRRVVLITDGRETEGDIRRAVWEAKRRGVRVFTVPARTRGPQECWVEQLEVPEGPRAGEPVDIDVRLFCGTSASGTVELKRSGTERVDTKKVDLDEGVHTVGFRSRFDSEGLALLETSFDGAHPLHRVLSVAPRPKLAVIEGDRRDTGYLARALGSEGFELTRLALAELPERLEDFDAVILSNVVSESLDERKMEEIAAYVQGGGGLIFIAGETSFGQGAYHDTLLEQILPVRFQVLEKRKEVALLIVLDKSYSMTGEKIALAKEATKAALDLLEDHHEFGVVAFDWYPRVVVDLQPAKPKRRIKEAVDKVAASDPTRIYPALEKAYEMLRKSSAKVKHVILLSDGRSQRADFEAVVQRMRTEDMTISTVSVGKEADRGLLARIARWGNGRSYLLEDPRKVPEVFIREAQMATENTLVEKPFRPTVRWEVEALTGVDLAAAPHLLGYVNMQPKETAEVLIESPTSAPILARWRYGLGKSVVFTSDAKDRWAARWLGWEGYGKFWSQLIRETMKRPGPANLDFRVRRKGAKARITLEVVDGNGRFRNELQPRVEIVDGKGRSFTATLRQHRPGGYEAELPLAVSPAPYVFRLLEPTASDKVLERAVVFPYPDEDTLAPPDMELLRAVSDATGGRFHPDGADIFADYGDRARRSIPLGPLASGMALVLYLLDIALRRLAGLRPLARKPRERAVPG